MQGETNLKSLVVSLGDSMYRFDQPESIYSELGLSLGRFVELLARDFYCPTLDAEPDSSTVSYTDSDGSTNHFAVGQPCRWLDEEGCWQISVLKSAQENVAEWYTLPTKMSQLRPDLEVGGVNLLRNSGFTGDYTYEELESDSNLGLKTELYSRPLKYWEGTAEVVADSSAKTGKAAVLGNISQSVSLEEGVRYVFSFLAKGKSVKVSCGSSEQEVLLSSKFKRYILRFTFSGSGEVKFSGDATVCDLQLERGSVATDWKPSILDNDKALAELQGLKHLTDGIKDNSTGSLKGMALASVLNLGNYKDGELQKTNAGLSGVYNDDNDVAFWGGGDIDKAIATLMAFKENPSLLPEDWSDLCSFVVSHGGDGVYRGKVFATGGEIQSSKVSSDAYFANGRQGVTQTISIPCVGGNQELEYVNGILVSSKFIIN